MNLRRFMSDIAFEDRLADQYEGGGEIRSFVMVVTDERSTSNRPAGRQRLHGAQRNVELALPPGGPVWRGSFFKASRRFRSGTDIEPLTEPDL